MDRTTLAICAGILCPLGAVLNLGCNAQHANPGATAQAIESPTLLQPPGNNSPAWKELEKFPVVPTSGLAEESVPRHSEGTPGAMPPAEVKSTVSSPQAEGVRPKCEVSPSSGEDEALESPTPDNQPPADAARVAGADRYASATPLEPIPERCDLPWAHIGPRRPEMMAVAIRADQRVQRGFQLAGRGALYSARAEFVAAIHMIAQANDAQQNTRLYTKALTAGLVALQESGDFVRQHTAHPDIDAARIIVGHKTPILKSTPAAELTAMFAAQSYYNYAQEQLAAAAAQDQSGSMALYGMGKIAMAAPGATKSQQLEHTAQAMSCYQAALMAVPNNFRAANELGVLLAENGSLQQARELLIRSAMLSSQGATWQNLAAVHFRLGEQQLAEQARQRALAMQQGRNSLVPTVEWVDPATFAASAPSTDGLVQPSVANPKPASTQGEPAKPTKFTAKKGIADWLPQNPWR